MDRRDLQRFFRRQGRQERGQSPREHRLAGARGADHHDVVIAGGGYLERASCSGLTANVGEVVGGRLQHLFVAGLCERQLSVAPKGSHELCQRSDRAHLQAIDQRRLGCVRARDDGAFYPAGARPEELRQDASYRLNGALERQLSHEQHPSQRVARSRAERAEDGRCDGQVEPAAGFSDVGRGQIDHDATLVDVHAHLRECALDPHATLADGGFSQADELEEGRTSYGRDLDPHGVSLKTDERGTERGGKHGGRHGALASDMPTHEKARNCRTEGRAGGVSGRSRGVQGR